MEDFGWSFKESPEISTDGLEACVDAIDRMFGHPKASGCFAWVHEDNDGKTHYTAVLAVPPVDSTRSAVRARIAAQVKGEPGEGKET